MASWISQPSVHHNLGNFTRSELPPTAAHTLTGVQTRSRKAQTTALSQSLIAAPQASKHARTRPITRSLKNFSAMKSNTSSCSLDSHRSKSEQSSDDEWMSSTESDNTTKKPEIEVFRFTDLPKELRRLMYSYLLSIPPGEEFQLDQSIIDWSFSAVSAAILKVSKEIYLDAFPVFLRENKFLIGTSLTNPHIFRTFGPKRCVYLRTLSVQLNDRPVKNSIQILDELSQYCNEIRHLELRVSPGSPFLPHLTSIFVARTQAGASSRANVVLRFSVRKSDATPATGQADLDRAAENIQQSFKSTFRWPVILQRAHEITIKGCIHRSSLDVLENFKHEGWHFARNVTTPVENCTTIEENVTRKWGPVDKHVQEAGDVDVRHPQRWR